MDAYTSFASVYDTFMDDVPYEEWGVYLIELLKEHGVENGVVVDLGCGTGSMTEILSRVGYDMIGIDNSEEMLGIAAKKKEYSEYDILYLLQDMCELELYSTANAFVSVCDCVNYVTNPEELLETFRHVSTYLEEDGVFIFDFNTEHKYRDIIGDTTIAENRDECSFIWDNYYYEEEHINEYELSLFIQSESDPSMYRKFEETHYQRGYTLAEMKELIQKSGLSLIAAYNAFTREEADEMDERIYIVAKRENKK